MQRTKRAWRGFTSFQRNVLFLLLILLSFMTYILFLTSRESGTPELLRDQRHIHPKFRAITKAPAPKPEVVVAPSSDIQVDRTKFYQPYHSGSGGGKTIETTPSVRQKAVIEAMQHSWKAYELYAWGKDEVHPLTRTSSEWMGAGLTLVDALDTLWIMGLRKEFDKARAWVAQSLSFDIDKQHTNVFETTIRLLGGLVATYHLSGDKLFLEKAQDLGERLMPAFDMATGIPYSDINLHSGVASSPVWTRDSSTAEASTVQLELRELARLTGVDKFALAANHISERFHQMGGKKDGLVPIYVDPQNGVFRSGSTISLGARGDSYYEYLIKQFVQSGKQKSFSYLAADWKEAVQGIKQNLLRQTEPHKLTFVGELLGGTTFSPKMDHLVCFLPGALAYGYYHGMPKEHLELAKELMKTCYLTYTQSATGLAPEITYFNLDSSSTQGDMYIKPLDRHNIQRPETVESLFYMWRVTGDRKYQDWGWNILEAFNKYTKINPAGYVSISDVTNPKDVGVRTKCESFWFSETLKYFFLLFSEDSSLIPLDRWVFNTEGHPLPLWNSTASLT